MRNLTKVLAMVLALTMMVSVVGFAASYTDVDSEANYAEAVQVLSDLGLVQGMGDGTFGADLNLTRAQGAAFVIRLMGLEETAVSSTGLNTGFSDVPADHWASGYIYVGVQEGVINGMGDGTFAPDAELTFAQIVKMVVVALGYEPLASELGEWPGNYMSAATQIKLTKGIAGKADASVTRATTARILYAALTIPKMEKKGVGVNAIWEPLNTLILDDLGFYKMIGKITNVDLVDNEVTVTLTAQGKAKAGEYKEVTTDTDMPLSTATYDMGAFGAELKDFINIDAALYFTVDGRDEVLVSVVEDVKNVETIKLRTSDVDEYVIADDEVVYFTNAEQTKDDEFKLASSVATYVNGGAATARAADTFASMYLTSAEEFEIEIKDTNGDGEFDYAIVTDYSYMIVKDIDVSKSGVYTIKSETIANEGIAKMVVETEEDNVVKFIKNGKEIGIDEVAVGDILNIVASGESFGNTPVSVATVYVTNETVEGVVKYADAVENYTCIGDVEYPYIVSDSTVAASAEGTFYINILGQIFYADDSVVTAGFDYGFVTTVDFEMESDGIAEKATVTMLTTEGKWVTLDVNGKLAINGAASVEIEGYDPATFATAVSSSNPRNQLTDNRDQVVYINNIVAYKLNSAGAVKEILTSNSAMSAANITNNLALTKTYKEYEGEDSMFGGYSITEDVVVYNVVAGYLSDNKVKEDEIEVTDLSVFADDQSYTADLYNINAKSYVPAVVFGQFVADLDFEANWLVVSSAYDVLYNDEIVTQLTGTVNGDTVVYYYISGESEVKDMAATTGEITNTGSAVTTFAKGDVLIVKANAENEIVKASLIGQIGDYVTGTPTGVNFTNLEDKYFNAVVAGENDSWFAAGFVAKVDGTKAYIYTGNTASDLLTTGALDEAKVDAYVMANDPVILRDNTVVTVYDYTASSKNTVSAGDISDIEEGSAVFMRVDEYNRAAEVVVIITETEY